MNERVTVITRKGQITIPAEIRKALKLSEGDRVAISLNGEEVKVRRSQSVVARTAGIARSELPPLSAEEERRVAEEMIAEAAAERAEG